MNVIQLVALWLLGWVLIIVLRTLYIKNHNVDMNYDFVSGEMLEDGNNLFATGLVYLVGNLVCHFFRYTFLCWTLMIIGVIAAIPACISVLVLIIQKDVPTLQKGTAFICSVLPLSMAINIFFVYIL